MNRIELLGETNLVKFNTATWRQTFIQVIEMEGLILPEQLRIPRGSAHVAPLTFVDNGLEVDPVELSITEQDDPLVL